MIGARAPRPQSPTPLPLRRALLGFYRVPRMMRALLLLALACAARGEGLNVIEGSQGPSQWATKLPGRGERRDERV
jgi:hypothetical protein